MGVWWGELWRDHRRGQRFHQFLANQGHQVLPHTCNTASRCHLIHLCNSHRCVFPGGGCPVKRRSPTLGWQRLTLESWRPRICPRKRWRSFLPDRSGRWCCETLYLSVYCIVFFWSMFFLVVAAIVFKQKAGKALLALKRMTLLSKGESTASAHIPKEGKTHTGTHTFLDECIAQEYSIAVLWYHPPPHLLLLPLSQAHCWAQRQKMSPSLWSTRCRDHLSSPRAWRTRQWLQGPAYISHVTLQVQSYRFVAEQHLKCLFCWIWTPSWSFLGRISWSGGGVAVW